MTRPTWKRIEPGWYTTTVDGVTYEVMDMRGQAVRYTGLGFYVFVKRDGDIVHDAATIRDAKAWVEETTAGNV